MSDPAMWGRSFSIVLSSTGSGSLRIDNTGGGLAVQGGNAQLIDADGAGVKEVITATVAAAGTQFHLLGLGYAGAAGGAGMNVSGVVYPLSGGSGTVDVSAQGVNGTFTTSSSASVAGQGFVLKGMSFDLVALPPPPGTSSFDNGAGDKLWTTAANWNPDGVPVSPNGAEIAGYDVVLSTALASSPAELKIIIINTDDMAGGQHFHFEGRDCLTPTIDTLASTGIRFTSAFAASTVCGPSRYALFTSRWPSRNTSANYISTYPLGTLGRFGVSDTELEDDRQNIGAWLQQAGYRTGMVGKSHLTDDDQLFNLTTDPTEQSNLYGQEPATAYDLKKRLASYIGAIPGRPFRGFSDSSTEFSPAPAVAPAPPGTLQIQFLNPHSVKLDWSDTATSELGYVVRKTVNGGASRIIAELPSGATTTTTAALDPDSEDIVLEVASYNALGDTPATLDLLAPESWHYRTFGDIDPTLSLPVSQWANDPDHDGESTLSSTPELEPAPVAYFPPRNLHKYMQGGRTHFICAAQDAGRRCAGQHSTGPRVAPAGGFSTPTIHTNNPHQR